MMPREKLGLAARLRVSGFVGTLLLLTSAACTSDPADDEEDRAAEPSGAGTPITIMGAGDIAKTEKNPRATADLILEADPDAVFTLGDNAYPDGSLSDYEKAYDPTWGAFKDRTHPVPGNHEYHSDPPAGYLDYFGRENVTNDVDGGLYYAWDVGNGWRAYAMNTEIDTDGDQLEWLQDDLAEHPGQHYILQAHSPRYTSGADHEPSDDICPLWDALAETGGLEIVLTGHNHQYERFEKMDCEGRQSADGAVSFVVGSGGGTMYEFGRTQRGSEFRNDTDYGVLKLTLYEDSWEWEFLASGLGYNGKEGVDRGNAAQVLDKGSDRTDDR